MAVDDLFASDWGDLQIAAPVIGDRTDLGSPSLLEQQIRQLVENPLPEMRTYLDALPDQQVETLIIKLLIAMGIEISSIGLVQKYERRNGVLISGKWNTTTSVSVDVLVRVTHRERPISGGDLVQMLTGRDHTEHLIVFTPRTWLQNTTTQTAPGGRPKVHFVDRVQLLALFMRYGVGCHRKVVEIHTFDQGLWLSDVNAASIAYSRLLNESEHPESSTAKAVSALAICAPSDSPAADLYWDCYAESTSGSLITVQSCPKWPDMGDRIALSMSWPDAYLDDFQQEELDCELLDPNDGRNWDAPEWPDVDLEDPIDYCDGDPVACLGLEKTELQLENDCYDGYQQDLDDHYWSETAFWEKDEFVAPFGESHGLIGSVQSDQDPFMPAERAFLRRHPRPQQASLIPRGQMRRDGVREADAMGDPYDDWEFNDELNTIAWGESRTCGC